MGGTTVSVTVLMQFAPRQAEQTRRAARALEPRVSSLIVFHGPDTTSPRHLRSLQANLQGRPDWAGADVLQTELPGLGFQEAARHQGVARRSAEQGSRVLHELKENAQRRSSRICWPERRWLRTEALKFSQLQISEQMARQGSFTNVKSGHPGGLFHRSAIVPDIHGLVSRRVDPDIPGGVAPAQPCRPCRCVLFN